MLCYIFGLTKTPSNMDWTLNIILKLSVSENTNVPFQAPGDMSRECRSEPMWEYSSWQMWKRGSKHKEDATRAFGDKSRCWCPCPVMLAASFKRNVLLPAWDAAPPPSSPKAADMFLLLWTCLTRTSSVFFIYDKANSRKCPDPLSSSSSGDSLQSNNHHCGENPVSTISDYETQQLHNWNLAKSYKSWNLELKLKKQTENFCTKMHEVKRFIYSLGSSQHNNSEIFPKIYI